MVHAFLNLRRFAIGCVFFLLSTSVFAAGAGFYMGLQVGVADLHNLNENINTGWASVYTPQLPAGNATPCDSDVPGSCIIAQNVVPTNKGIAERVFLGANINRFAGFELGIANYTPSEYSPDSSNTYKAHNPAVVVPSTPPNPNSGPSHEPHIWEYSMDILGKLMLPLGRFGIFGKAGIAFVYQSVSSAADVNDMETSSSIFYTPMVSAGVSFEITPNWEIEAAASRIKGTDQLQDIDFVGIGLSYHMVQEYCGQFLC